MIINKLYYLQFLSGQPVWNMVKNNTQDTLNQDFEDESEQKRVQNNNLNQGEYLMKYSIKLYLYLYFILFYS